MCCFLSPSSLASALQRTRESPIEDRWAALTFLRYLVLRGRFKTPFGPVKSDCEIPRAPACLSLFFSSSLSPLCLFSFFLGDPFLTKKPPGTTKGISFPPLCCFSLQVFRYVTVSRADDWKWPFFSRLRFISSS